jgi:hypothetical protein
MLGMELLAPVAALLRASAAGDRNGNSQQVTMKRVIAFMAVVLVVSS